MFVVTFEAQGIRLKANPSEAPLAERVASGNPYRWGLREEAFSEVTGERAPSFRDLFLGETAALSHSTLLMALSKVEGLVEGNAEGAKLPWR
jgi:hypothetical protein